MSMVQLEVQAPTTEVLTLDDGMVVRLSGHLDDAEALVSLRKALLTDRPRGVDDVIVDAGEVAGISEGAVAVLCAAIEWAKITGGRLSFTRLSQPVTAVLDELGLSGELPQLADSRVGLPAQRRPRD